MTTDHAEPIAAFASALRAQAAATGHRRLLVLAGDAGWARHAAAASGAPVWIGTEAPDGARLLPASRARELLGGEVDGLVLDLHAGLDVDVLGAVSGTVRAGGLLVLATPPLEDWAARPDPALSRIAPHPHTAAAFGGGFVTRLVAMLRADPDARIVEQHRPLPRLPRVDDRDEALPPAPDADGCLTDDQRTAVDAVVRVALGRRRRPVVLSADRGRGKSAALGIAAARLLSDDTRRILVTAPHRDAVDALFERVRRLCPDAVEQAGALRVGDATLRFVPADELLRLPVPADLLLVDEAAALPAALLEGLLNDYARIAFATTVHGYEGSGRGFALRFAATLDRRTPGWRTVRLRSPVRWREEDPVERFVFRSLLLNGRPADASMLAAPNEDVVQLVELDRHALAADETTLSELFGLLVLAHYRTTPGDLRQLLDAPDIALFVARVNGHVAATMLLSHEGGLDEPTAREIFAGRRRVRGHLLAQSLATHAGLAGAPRLRGVRVQRIAVHPAQRRRGLGRALIEAAARHTAIHGCDYLGASFGADPELLGFWHRGGCEVVRVGLHRETSSGAHALQVIRGISPAGRELVRVAGERHARQLPVLLAGPLRDLDPALAARLLARLVGTEGPREEELADAATFAFALRGADLAMPAIARLLPALLGTGALPPDVAAALVARFVQHRDWSEVAERLGEPGRNGAVERLRVVLQQPLRAVGGETLARLERQLAPW